MLPYIQALLLLAGGAFCYFLGATFENFLMEVVRHFVPIAPENVWRYNIINLAVSLVPLLGIGLLLHLAIGSEEHKRARMWKILSGVALAVLGYRLHHVFHVLQSSTLEGAPEWETRISSLQLFWERLGGFLILGICSLLPSYFVKNDMKSNIKDIILTIALSLFWLGISHTLVNRNELSNLFLGGLTAFSAAITLFFLSRKVEIL